MLEGIISIRQYRRYLYGEVEIPFGVVAQLATKMNITPKKLFLEFEKERNKETQIISSYYNAVISNEMELAKKIHSQIDKDNIIDHEQFLFFKSANYIYNFKNNNSSCEEVVKLHKELINYPEILSNKILTDNELYLLGTISEYDSSTKAVIMEKFISIYENDQLQISGNNILTMTQVIFWLAKYTGSLKQYDKTILFCNEGIKYNNQYKGNYLLEYFYYYQALAYYYTDRIDEYKSSLYKAILSLELLPLKGKTLHFYQIIKKDLNVEPLQFIRDFIDGKLKESKE
jgi:hypothetical protein